MSAVTLLTDPDTFDPSCPRQLRFPGQSAAPPGPVDLCSMYLVHHAVRRDLRRFAAAVAATPSSDRATWRSLQRRWSLFADILRHHQQGEDLGVWPRLREGADIDERGILWDLEAEHDEIDPLLRECRQGFHRLADHDDPEVHADLRMGVAAARRRIEEHLDHEERSVMPIIQARLTDQEWRRIEREHFRAGRPPAPLPELVAWAFHEVPDDLRTEVRIRSGLLARILWRLSHRRFERGERGAFRYGERAG